MKRIRSYQSITALLFLLSAGAQAQMMKLGDVLVFHVPEVKTNADFKAFEAHVRGQAVPAWKQSVPGTELNLVRKDRGNHKGRYALVYSSGAAARRKDAPATPATSDLLAKVKSFRPGLEPYVNGEGKYLEYRLVAPEKAGALPEVDVLGIHYIKVRPDRREAFDQFIAEKLHPTVGNLRPDLRLLYYKPVGGADPGTYLTIFALTKSSRDKYWPNGSDSEELKATFKPLQALAEELKGYLVEGSYATGNLAAAVYESREWADWVL